MSFVRSATAFLLRLKVLIFCPKKMISAVSLENNRLSAKGLQLTAVPSAYIQLGSTGDFMYLCYRRLPAAFTHDFNSPNLSVLYFSVNMSHFLCSAFHNDV